MKEVLGVNSKYEHESHTSIRILEGSVVNSL